MKRFFTTFALLAVAFCASLASAQTPDFVGSFEGSFYQMDLQRGWTVQPQDADSAQMFPPDYKSDLEMYSVGVLEGQFNSFEDVEIKAQTDAIAQRASADAVCYFDNVQDDAVRIMVYGFVNDKDETYLCMFAVVKVNDRMVSLVAYGREDTAEPRSFDIGVMAGRIFYNNSIPGQEQPQRVDQPNTPQSGGTIESMFRSGTPSEQTESAQSTNPLEGLWLQVIQNADGTANRSALAFDPLNFSLVSGRVDPANPGVNLDSKDGEPETTNGTYRYEGTQILMTTEQGMEVTVGYEIMTNESGNQVLRVDMPGSEPQFFEAQQ